MSVFDYDYHSDKMVKKYLEEKESNMIVSSCCGVNVDAEDDTCPECGGEFSFITWGDYQYNQHESYAEMKGDDDRDERRNRDEE